MVNKMWRGLSTGDRIESGHIRFAVLLALPVYVLTLVGLFWVPNPFQSIEGGPLLIDYLSFWTAARDALNGNPAAIYDLIAFKQSQFDLTGSETFFSFFYPPTFLLTVLPFGYLSFEWAFVTFVATGFGLLLISGRAITGSWWIALCLCAVPAVANNFMHGQNAALSAALLGFALVAIERRRFVWAGVFIGLMTFKPQLGVLIPFALVASSNWRSFLSAGAVAILFALASLTVFGFGVWLAFYEQIPVASGTLENGWVDWNKMISVYAAVRTLGGSSFLAWGAQLTVSAAVVIAVCRTWSAPAPHEARAMVLVGGSLLATPFALSYDLTLLIVAIGFLVRQGLEHGFLTYEKTALALIVILSSMTSWSAIQLGIPIAPLLPAGLVWMGLRRTSNERQSLAMARCA